jgi:hypothetical protein
MDVSAIVAREDALNLCRIGDKCPFGIISERVMNDKMR